MDLRITDDQAALAAGVRAFFEAELPPSRLRMRTEGGADDSALWQAYVAMGLSGLCAPERLGGLGMGALEAALVAIECGRACAPGALVDTGLTAAPLLAARGEDALTAAIARGDAIVALAHARNPWIADLDGATMVLGAGETGLARRDAALFNAVSPSAGIDPNRRLFGFAEGRDDDALLDRRALMAAAELLGLAEAMVDQACAYARTRTQFGQPIGGFQAIKHALATIKVAVDFARPVVLRAARALDLAAPNAPLCISHAKIAAGDAAWAAAETAIQVHGAMGYTYEVDLHFWMKRTWALVGAWGDRAFHLDRIDETLFPGAAPIGPTRTFG
jgi:alkylation response protein AidB-like acyl-CoA dehydrogenase